jgi:serine/threonine protein kinase
VPYGSIFITYLRGYIFIFNQRLLREINVWSSVHHPNIAPILGLSYDFHQPGVPCIVMPYYGYGVITNYLQKQPNVSKVALVGSYQADRSRLLNVAPAYAGYFGIKLLTRQGYYSW